jgi:hypothetical protein
MVYVATTTTLDCPTVMREAEEEAYSCGLYATSKMQKGGLVYEIYSLSVLWG